MTLTITILPSLILGMVMTIIIMKTFKGEKYIYLLMGYMLAKQQTKGYISIGNDDGMKGGQNFWRSFSVQEWNGKTLLIETKSNSSSATFSRTFEVIGAGTTIIREYFNEDNENCSNNWVH